MVPSDCSLTLAGFLTGVARALQLLLPALAMVRITFGFRGEWLTMMANVASEGRLFSLKDFRMVRAARQCGVLRRILNANFLIPPRQR